MRDILGEIEYKDGVSEDFCKLILRNNLSTKTPQRRYEKARNTQKKIEKNIIGLLNLTEGYIPSQVSAQEMEKDILTSLLDLGHELLNYVIASKSKLLSKQRKEEERKYSGMEYKGSIPRKYLSIFGLMEFHRDKHWNKEQGVFYELDEQLNLPPNQLSYHLQEWIGDSSSTLNFRESVKLLNKILGLNLSGKLSERNTEILGKYVEGFYEEKEVDLEESASCYSASFDGKGVPKIMPVPEKEGNPKKRLGRGEKRGRKEMATVSVTSVFQPKKRTKASILRGLMENVQPKKKQEKEVLDAENDNRWNQKIHRRAFLANQSKAIEYGLNDIRKRMKNPSSRFVVPIDAGKGLENKILAYIKAHKMDAQFDGIIIDIIHVSEYIWDASTVLFEEQSELRSYWIKMALEMLLDNKVDELLNDLKYTRDQERLNANQIKQLNKTITYLTNNGHNMDYKGFIEKGYPICSALVESTCGHLIKDRMEDSGMRWSSKGAQNMMDLRAVKINGDMDNFMRYVVKQQRKKHSKIAA